MKRAVIHAANVEAPDRKPVVVTDVDLVLGKNEEHLFSLMRDGVIQSIVRTQAGLVASEIWTVTILEPRGTFTRRFTDSTALGAFLKTLAYLVTEKLNGQEIYSAKAKRKRAELGL